MLRWATSSAAFHMHTRDPGSGGGQGQQAVASASSQQGRLPLFLTWGLSDLSTRIILNKCHIFSLFLLGKRDGLIVFHLPCFAWCLLSSWHSTTPFSLCSCAGLVSPQLLSGLQ